MAAGHGTGYTAGGAVTGTGGVIATVAGLHAGDALSSDWFLVGVAGIVLGVVILTAVGTHHGVTAWKALRKRRVAVVVGTSGTALRSSPQPTATAPRPRPSDPTNRAISVLTRPPRGAALKGALMEQEAVGKSLQDRIEVAVFPSVSSVLYPAPGEADVSAWETAVGKLLVDHREMHRRFFAPVGQVGLMEMLVVDSIFNPPLLRRLRHRLTILRALIEGLD